MTEFKITNQTKMDIRELEYVLKKAKFRKDTRINIIHAILPWVMVRDEDVIPDRFYHLGEFMGVPMFFDTKSTVKIYGSVDRIKYTEQMLKNALGMNNVRSDASNPPRSKVNKND